MGDPAARIHMSRSARRHRRLVSAAVGGLVATLLAIGPANPAGAAAPVFHGPFSFSGSFVEPDFCGVEAQVDWNESGRTTIRPVKNSDGQAFFGHTRFTLTEVISTTAGSITIVTQKAFHEQRATHVEGNVWQFQWVDAGTFTVYDAAGRPLLRETGVTKAREQFDTLGDSQPGGNPIPGTLEILARHGRAFDDDTFCETVLPHLT